MIGVRVAIRPVRLFGINLNDRDQWQAEITHFPEQAMQRGLIDHRARQDGCSVAFVGDAQALKPVGPPVIKVSLEANFVQSRLVMILVDACVSLMLRLVHVRSCGCISTSLHRVLFFDQKIHINVVSRHHHMW